MNTTQFPCANTPTLPEVHLIVAPPGHEAAIDNLLATADPSSVLAWRLAASYARLLTDTDLDTVMTEALQKGHQIVVWHGHDGWSSHSLFLRLGKDFVNLSKCLSWARLELPANASDTEMWSHLLEQLNTPDEADLRRYLKSEGQLEPQWEVSDALNAQGLKAFRNWVETYLDPALHVWDDDEDTEEPDGNVVSPQASASDDIRPVQWPWQDTVTWVAQGWLSASQIERIGRSDEPANQDSLRLKAARLQGAAAGRETLTAYLHPVSADDLWEAESLGQAPTGQKTKHASAVSVRISRPADDQEAPYTIEITLPQGDGGTMINNTWCLWLHLGVRLPLALTFVARTDSASTEVLWSAVTPQTADSQPSGSLWTAIQDGSVSLERL